jgi:hypothetical protein
VAHITRHWRGDPARIVAWPSALKHGISEERIGHAVHVCRQSLENPGWPGQTIHLAPDQYGNPLEVIGEIDDDGGLWVVHAMPLRRRYRDAYMEVNGHR